MLPSCVIAAVLARLPAEEFRVAEHCARFTAFDQDGDGIAEIDSLTPLEEAGSPASPRVVVLVEHRLLEPLEGAEEVLPRVRRLVQDLAAEGRCAVAVDVRLGTSALHQDGRTLLALREFLRGLWREGQEVAEVGALEGALLVGRFPDAYLVRTCNWRRKEDVTLHHGTPEERTYQDAGWLRRVPEDVAHRCDLVLADLDGAWEDLYVQPRTRLETISAVFDGSIPQQGGPVQDLDRGGRVFEDFFHVSDGRAEVCERLGAEGQRIGSSLFLHDNGGDQECSPDDLRQPNRIARPDIRVSRIDARGTAQRPRASVRGVDGGGLLDDSGRPRTLAFESAEATPESGSYEEDPVFERRLLAEYLDRNHGYRSGSAPIAFRPSSISCDLGSGYDVVRSAAADWADGDAAQADVSGRPTLEQFVDWMQYPAVLRTLRAHSDRWGSVFRKAGTQGLDERFSATGVYAWIRSENQLVPSLRHAAGGGKLDWYLLRTLYESGREAHEPALYLHTGCEAISPPNAENRPYDDPAYGRMQGAEALLFFGNGLALVGRAKVFYDEPAGFCDVLREGGTFGDAWAHYHDVEAAAPNWGRVGGDIGRKRAYFWSVLGDFSLRLRSPTSSRPGTEAGSIGEHPEAAAGR